VPMGGQRLRPLPGPKPMAGRRQPRRPRSPSGGWPAGTRMLPEAASAASRPQRLAAGWLAPAPGARRQPACGSDGAHGRKTERRFSFPGTTSVGEREPGKDKIVQICIKTLMFSANHVTIYTQINYAFCLWFSLGFLFPRKPYYRRWKANNFCTVISSSSLHKIP